MSLICWKVNEVLKGFTEILFARDKRFKRTIIKTIIILDYIRFMFMGL